VQDVVHALHGALRDRQIGEVPFEELRARGVIEVAALAGDQAVHDTDAVAAAYQLCREVRANEPGASGHEI
jgi:hypothetical protein